MSSPESDVGEVRALVLAAGFGTRLAPVTDHLPKPLLPVGGEPLLDLIIDRLLAAGVPEVAVNSHHRGELVAAHVADHRHTARLVHFPEPEILGTGGALDNARGFLTQSSAFVVYNGDVLCDVDLADLLAAHHNSGALATLLLVDWPAVNSVTLTKTGTISHIGGTGGEPVSAPDDRQLTYAGIGVFERELLADIGPGFSSLIDPLVRALAKDPGAVRGYVPDAVAWDDLGTLTRWLNAAGSNAQTGAGFQLTRITGHGSDRQFWRLGYAEWSAVAMISPPHDEEFERFVAVGHFLAAQNLGPAEFLTVDEPGKTVLMEDLGTNSLWSLANAKSTEQSLVRGYYEQVVDQLLALQASTPQARANCPLAVDRTLGLDQLRWETTYFRERFLVGHLGLAESDLGGLEAEFATLAAVVAKAPLTLMHRDFQSQNILIQGPRVRLVDYQGLRLGPVAYDLASLVWDPYVDLSPTVRRQLVTRFAAGCTVAEPSVVSAMTITAGLQRVMQALGAFGFLGHVKGKAEFLDYIPAAVDNLRLLLQELAALQTDPEVAVAEQLPPPMPQLTGLINSIVPQKDCTEREV